MLLSSPAGGRGGGRTVGGLGATGGAELVAGDSRLKRVYRVMKTRTVSLLLCCLDYLIIEEFANQPVGTQMREGEKGSLADVPRQGPGTQPNRAE